MHFLIYFLIEENNLFLKAKDHFFTMDFWIKLVVLGFLKALYSYNTLREGSQCGDVFLCSFLNHIVDLESE